MLFFTNFPNKSVQDGVTSSAFPQPIATILGSRTHPGPPAPHLGAETLLRWWPHSCISQHPLAGPGQGGGCHQHGQRAGCLEGADERQELGWRGLHLGGREPPPGASLLPRPVGYTGPRGQGPELVEEPTGVKVRLPGPLFETHHLLRSAGEGGPHPCGPTPPSASWPGR